MIHYACKHYKLFIGSSTLLLVYLTTHLRSMDGPNWIGFNLPIVVLMIFIGGLDIAIYRKAKAMGV